MSHLSDIAEKQTVKEVEAENIYLSRQWAILLRPYDTQDKTQ